MGHAISRSVRIGLGILPLMLAGIGASLGGEDSNPAESLKPGTIALCGTDGGVQTTAACKSGSLDRAAKQLDAAAMAAIAHARPATVPLIKRDQVWFRELIESYAENAGPADAEKIGLMLLQRSALLDDVAQGFGRAGVPGRWVNAFGTVEITPAPDGAFRVAASSDALYGSEQVQHQDCSASALVRPDADDWLAGDADVPANVKPDAGKKPARLKIRLQGETLRILAGDEIRNQANDADFNCSGNNQLTGSYFAAGKADAADGHGATAPFVAPSFGCASPATAAEEEICADPGLAANDVRLNRAWKALLPRLDAATRRLLTEDQREWLKSQGIRYPDQLHPASDKQGSFVHHTGLARDSLAQLQRERIAVLEGFDENRRGFEGEWWSYNARLSVTRNKNGTLNADGNKWFENDYKGGCDYDFNGTANGDVFVPDDKSQNPNTMQRDHGSLIVNRTDDVWAKRRVKADGTNDPDADEGKCKRSMLISSTARLFPVRQPANPDDGSR